MSINRPLNLKSPLKDDLAITSFQGVEPLGRLFQYELECFSPNQEISIDKILGQSVTVHFDDGADGVRYFNGIVSAISQAGQLKDERREIYQVTLRPWLWFLTRTADCRVFEQASVPDIIKQICKERGFSDIEDKMSESHKPWDYCVQYRETDFNFISRLMEEEGIYYYFTHGDDKHTLVLADSYSAHKSIRNDAVRFYPWQSGGLISEQYVSSWSTRCEVQPGAYALNDYDFRRPRVALRVREQVEKKHEGSKYEIYDFPGEYADRFEGSKGEYADLRIQELHVQHEQAEGATDLRIMATGGLFKLDKHPRKDQNKEYLVIDTAFEIAYGPFAGGDIPGISYQCQFTVIDAKTPFRSARVTPKPVIQGPQTAVVVDAGPDPEKYGRVKVRFFWDREEDDSCWVRVAQNSAGTGWGSVFPPHIGHEVIVSFLEGDPDRPIITGRVYNADNMPPDLWSGSIDNSVITDHVENKINIDGADVPIIHITQPSGNEILMNNDEGIQIRDHYGNEVVMDAQAGTLKIRSPTHESVFILGQSLYWSTDSNAKTLVKGDHHKLINGKSELNVGDITNNVFVGIKSEAQLASTNTMFVGLKNSVSKALDVSINKDVKIIKDNKVDRKAGTYVREKSPELNYSTGGMTLLMVENKGFARLQAGHSIIELKKGADISVKADTDLKLKASGGGVEIDSAKPMKLNGSQVVIKGNKIELG